MVSEQSKRDRVLCIQPKVPIATVTANTSSAVVRMKPKVSVNTVIVHSESSSSSSENSNGSPPGIKKARRVLPEHEGKYKITLPMGTTKRSQEILAKKASCKTNTTFIYVLGMYKHSI